MELERGKGDYPAPPVGLLIGARLDLTGYLYELLRVGPDEIEHQRAKSSADLLGRPVMFAHSEATDSFMFFPAPDAPCRVDVRYYPPAVTF